MSEFHKHLDVCAQCERNPFALCPRGAQLLQAEATAPMSERVTEQPKVCPDCGKPRVTSGTVSLQEDCCWVDYAMNVVAIPRCNTATIALLRSKLASSSLVIEAADRLRDEVGAVKSVPGALSKAALAYDDARRKLLETP